MKMHRLAAAAAAALLSAGAHAVLVSHYTFDGNANDSGARAANGTVNGALLTFDRFGAADSAYRFDGVNDFITATATGLPTASRTVAFWFLADSVANRPVMFGYGGGACGSSFFMGLNAGPGIYNNSYYASSHCDVNNLIYNYGAAAPVGSWNHVAVTTEASGSRMYVNGALVASNSIFINNTVVAGRALAIGVDVSPAGGAPYIDSNVGWFAGAIDDVRIYDTALSLDDIRQIAQIAQVPAIPEPRVSALMLVGLGLLMAAVRSRRSKVCHASA